MTYRIRVTQNDEDYDFYYVHEYDIVNGTLVFNDAVLSTGYHVETYMIALTPGTHVRIERQRDTRPPV